MIRFEGLAPALLFLITVFAGPVPAGAAGEGSDYEVDRAFVDLAREIDGFRMILNTPPAPNVKFLREPKEVVSFADFRGKVLLLNLWATWCPPCIREMPGLDALQRKLGRDGFEVLAVATGRQGQQSPADFLAENKLDALILYSDHHSVLMREFANETLPMSLLIDRQGRILGGVVGATEWDSPEAEAAIRYLLNQKAG